MILPFLLVLIALLVWLNVATFRRMRAGRVGRGWRMTLVFLWAIGALLGGWGGFGFQYQTSPTQRVIGAPIPMAIFQLEEHDGEQVWIDFVTPAPLLFAASNVLVVPMFLAAPVCLMILCLTRRDVGRAG